MQNTSGKERANRVRKIPSYSSGDEETTRECRWAVNHGHEKSQKDKNFQTLNERYLLSVELISTLLRFASRRLCDIFCTAKLNLCSSSSSTMIVIESFKSIFEHRHFSVRMQMMVSACALRIFCKPRNCILCNEVGA
jgi:hypothetical protein